MNLEDLPGLIADGRGAGVALQRLLCGEKFALRADFTEQAGSQFFTRTGERGKQGVVEVCGKQCFDLLRSFRRTIPGQNVPV